MKKEFGDIHTDDTKYQVENFILSCFAKVDKDERTCETVTKLHAVEFNRTAHFIQLLTCFGALEDEWKEREKYCKYKAGTILKALKEGKQPERGNPFAPPEEPMAAMSIEESKVPDESPAQPAPEAPAHAPPASNPYNPGMANTAPSQPMS